MMVSSGERDLAVLLREMTPTLSEFQWGFATTATPLDDQQLASLNPIASFAELEGLTVVAEWQRLMDAKSLFAAISEPMAQITLEVHSSLEAVGLTAAIANALTEADISANVMAAYYHDHVFVPYDLRQEALITLRLLQKAS